jgi:hypothetical protein
LPTSSKVTIRRSRIGYSSGIVAGALIVGLLVGAGVTYALAGSTISRTTTTTTTSLTTTTTTLPPATSTTTVTIGSTQDVLSTYSAHLQDIESQNASALIAEYENNAALNVKGCVIAGLGGVFTGTANISLWYQLVFRPGGYGIENLTDISSTVLSNETNAIVNSTFNMQGSAPLYIHDTSSLQYSASVRLGVSYVYVGNAWLISSEIWNTTRIQLSGQPDCG